ncbi:enoyl-CoA hydratase/isomerase family protein [Nocardioides carbamazepini]|uniref:enoyl-CoA hydratase-related protein n=1 Tax=Nocardioides carbamazepini TaxID=2854259 RepID=UPI00214A7F02|nr:enoyl-CoA hydratase-related protein [Nocardioides carbamazepini]MCR1783237.1 enoyl-CoA hydratase/isomerase family protein [Nocardioides carbamazepini]
MTTIETGTDHLLASVDEGVGTLTLNRPERRNALSHEMVEALGRAIPLLDEDPEVGCLVITGAGGAFCSGGDVLDFHDSGGEGGGADEIDPTAVAEQLEHQKLTVGALYRARTPVVASLPGAAAGAGLGLALAADLRVGSARALMVTAFASVGLSGDFGVAWLLQRLVGPAKARELLFLNPRVDAQAAADLGLLDRLCTEQELSAATTTLARRLADGPRGALAAIKQNLVDAADQTLEDSMAAEIRRHKACGITADHIAAVAAFAAKQKAVFNRS